MHACKMRGSKPASESSSPEGKEPLQVRIPARVKRAFKTHAAARDIEPNKLFVEVWEHYQRTRPDAINDQN